MPRGRWPAEPQRDRQRLSAALRWTVSLPQFRRRFPRRRRRRHPVGLGHWPGAEPAGDVLSTCLLTSEQARESGPADMATTQNPVLVANIARNNDRRAGGGWRLRLWNVPGLMDGASRARFNAKPYATCSTSPCHPVLSPGFGISGHRSRVESHD